MHYFTDTMDYKIHYFMYPTVLEKYNDVNWISNMDELYAISELLPMLLSHGGDTNRLS
jgi:hypothetical protein